MQIHPTTHPKVIYSLIKSVLIPQLTYSLPFIQLTKQYINKFESTILLPLRRSFGLPISTHKLSVQAELNIAPIDILQSTLQIRTLTCLMHPKSPQNTITKNVISYQWNAAIDYAELHMQLPHNIDLNPQLYRGSTLLNRMLMSCFAIPINPTNYSIEMEPTFTKLLKVSMKQQTYYRWHHSNNGGELLKTLKNDFGLSEVIKMTDMNFQRARTRWRMHRSPIASHQHRMNMVDSPICRQCRTTPRSNETDQHALLECSKHRRIRSDMLNALQARIPDITLSIPLLLGHKHTIEKYAGSSRKAKKFLYNSTGQFITLLCENRVEHVTQIR